MEPTIIAVCALNQLSLDFKGNRDRIIESIVQCKREHNAKIRVGPALETTGVSCEDHFLEADTIYHSWQVIKDILELTLLPPYDDILCVIGAPVINRSVIYNSGVFIYKGRIVLIKPKTILGNDGNYRESRWFTSYKGDITQNTIPLPSVISDFNQQNQAPFGNYILRTEDGYLIGAESGDELWSPVPISTNLFLQGAHIVLNFSASHFNLHKFQERAYLIRQATTKTGGVYAYANSRGCDGSRLYFDGASVIAVNGNIVQSSNQFSLNEVDVVSASIDLGEVDSFRTPVPSRSMQSEENLQHPFPVLAVQGLKLLLPEVTRISPPIQMHFYTKSEEVAYAPACYLWDYLRYSGAIGFLLPVSGGKDSSSALLMLYIMCEKVLQAYNESIGYNRTVMINDLRRICGEIPGSVRELMQKVAYTSYLATSNSSEKTRSIAQELTQQVGSRHLTENLDEIIESFKDVFVESTGCETPRFVAHGGSVKEDVALQNIQARSRMVFGYLLAQLLPWSEGRQGFLLALGTANLEECLTGYITKYDCSSADISPLGSISKKDLVNFLIWGREKYGFEAIDKVIDCPPTAELKPLNQGQLAQTDEDEMRMTYEEVSYMGRLRKQDHCGPLFMFKRLLSEWTCPIEETADKVKRFFIMYAKNRHKQTVLTPAVHMETYSCDDNRYDLRPFLYNTEWTAQFRGIDEIVAKNS